MVKQGTNQMIRFFVYSNLKNYLQEGDPTKDIGSIRTFIIGGIAGAASVFGNTPVDVVKTRMQVSCYFVPQPTSLHTVLFIDVTQKGLISQLQLGLIKKSA